MNANGLREKRPSEKGNGKGGEQTEDKKSKNRNEYISIHPAKIRNSKLFRITYFQDQLENTSKYQLPPMTGKKKKKTPLII